MSETQVQVNVVKVSNQFTRTSYYYPEHHPVVNIVKGYDSEGNEYGIDREDENVALHWLDAEYVVSHLEQH